MVNAQVMVHVVLLKAVLLQCTVMVNAQVMVHVVQLKAVLQQCTDMVNVEFMVSGDETPGLGRQLDSVNAIIVHLR